MIQTDQFQTESCGNNAPTTVTDLAVTDPNTGPSETYSFIAQAESGSVITPSSGSGSLSAINTAVGSVTYNPGNPGPAPLTDKIEFTVTSDHGTDTVHFVFNRRATDPVALAGTSGKDVIFATESNDTLTGHGGADQFVFAPAAGNVQHVVTDFETPLDKLDLRAFTAIDGLGDADITITQSGSDTLITLEGSDTILLQNVVAANLKASNFVFHDVFV